MSSMLVSSRVVRCTYEGIKNLFEDFRMLCRVVIQCNRNGRSLGTAEIAFTSRADACKVTAQFNGLALDDRLIKIIQVTPSGGRSNKFIKCNLTGYTC